MVTYPFNPSTPEAEAGQWYGSQSWLHSKILPQKYKTNEIHKKELEEAFYNPQSSWKWLPCIKNLSVQNILPE